MITLTFTRSQLHTELIKGDRIVAIDGHQLRESRVVEAPRWYTENRQLCVKIINSLNSSTNWNLYPGNVQTVTVERDDTPAPVESAPRVMTAQDFVVGQTAYVNADQGIREGKVTKIGRTRVTVRHPRNQRGDMVERAYALNQIILGTSREGEHDQWKLHYADGSRFYYRHAVLGRPNPQPPVPRLHPDGRA